MSKNRDYLDEDLEYFERKKKEWLEKGLPQDTIDRLQKQIDLIEDAIVIYREHRPPEGKNEGEN